MGQGHHHGILAPALGAVVVSAPADLAKAQAVVESHGDAVRQPHFQEHRFGASGLGALDQMAGQCSAVASALVAGFDADVEQPRFAGGVQYAVADGALAALGEQAFVVHVQAVQERLAGPRKLVGARLGGSHCIEISHVHDAKANRLARGR